MAENKLKIHACLCVVFQEVDIGVGPFTITSERLEVIDYLVPFTYEKLIMLMRKPVDDTKTSALIIFKPYTYQVSDE